MSDELARRELSEAGVPADLHDEALAVKPAFDRHGVWPILLALFRRVPSSECWRVVELAKALAGSGRTTPPDSILTFYQPSPQPEGVAVSLFMVFDVESVGLHGEGFAAGWVVIDGGREVASGRSACPPDAAAGTEQGRSWVAANVPPLATSRPEHWPPEVRTPYEPRTPKDVRAHFWAVWTEWKGRGAVLAADVPWPVEARFLLQCVDDSPDAREWQGPYPLLDVASVRLAAGLDPLGTEERRPDESPAHDPLADARQSARLLAEALSITNGRRPDPERNP